VTPLGVVPDGVASSGPDPLGNRLVLAKFLRQLQLNLQRLFGPHGYFVQLVTGQPVMLQTSHPNEIAT